MTSLLEKYGEKSVTPSQIQQELPKKEPKNLLEKYQETSDIDQDRIYQKYFNTPQPTREEYENMSLREKMQYAEDLDREQRYLHSKGISKGILSGATIGATENIKELQPKEHETGFLEGQIIGSFLPFGAISKVLSLPLKLIPAGYTALATAGRIGVSTATGLTHETARETIAGEELDPYAIGLAGLEFGALHSFFEAIPAAYNWFKSLNTGQKSQMLVEGTIPKDLSKNQWKFYSEEVQPELSKIAESEYKSALEKTAEEANTSYQQKLANAKAQHEQDMVKMAQENRLNETDALRAQEKYNNQLKQVAAEHEMEMSSIQKQNQQAMQEYADKQQEWQRTLRREELVQSALNREIPETAESLQGRVKPRNEDLTIRPEMLQESQQSLKNQIGSIISPERVANTTEGGFKSMQAVRASDQADYAHVNELYKISEDLNKTVQGTHPELVGQLDKTIAEIDAIPEPSAPQKQIKNTAQKIKDQLVQLDSAGDVAFYKPMSNQVLLEQAKALRYSIDFDFAHGNPKNIFKPTINALQDAAENAALATGNKSAYEANQKARQTYKEWANLYENDFIKKFRDTSNHKFSQTYDSSLNVDDFVQLDKVLQKSNSGQNLSNQIRRDLINKELEVFIRNPKSAHGEIFDEAIAELAPILKGDEAYQIRQQFISARKTPEFQAKVLPGMEKVKGPKTKEFPQKVNIPTKKISPKKSKEITSVKIPLKGELKPSKEMIASAKKMERTPEQIMKMTDTPTGLRELKHDLSSSEPGKRLFERIGQQKVKDILQGGKVDMKFTGDELYKTIRNGDNYSLLSEILGEDVTEDLLNASRQISSKKITKDMIKKSLTKVGSLKALYIFGIL